MKLSTNFNAFVLPLVILCCSGSSFGAEFTVDVPMRDGKKIKTYVLTPEGQGPWHVILKKGYNMRKSGSTHFAKSGFVFVAQGVRNGVDPHGISGNPRFFADDLDGYDTIEWIAKQSWCTGKVVMHGESYFGATQWYAAANTDPGPPPHLAGINPCVTGPDKWERSYRSHGAMNLSMAAPSRAFLPNQATYENFMRLPLVDLDKQVSGVENVLWNEYTSHWHYLSPGLNGQPYWGHIGMRDKYQKIKIPVYIYAGWWDYYAGVSLKYYNRLRALGHTPEIRIWINDVGHKPMLGSEVVKWYRWVLDGQDKGFKNKPPVKLFVQGIDKFEYFEEWPPKGTHYVPYFFHSENGAKNGTLTTKAPGTETPSSYSYDPKNPVPSIGGNANHRGLDRTLSNGSVLESGSFDQRPVENRPDVLVFTSPVLERDVEVIGPLKIKLYAKTDVKDTDFTAVLCDVLPTGEAMNVSEGIMRARFRNSIWEMPQLLTPKKIYKYDLEMMPTARVFKKGHRFRVHLSSSRFPLWDRNTNTGNDPHTDTQTVVAHQTIYHDQARPSHIVLPMRNPTQIRSENHGQTSPGLSMRMLASGRQLKINYVGDWDVQSSLDVSDIRGARFAKLQLHKTTEGMQAKWNTSRISAGVYFLQLRHKGKSCSRKFVKAR